MSSTRSSKPRAIAQRCRRSLTVVAAALTTVGAMTITAPTAQAWAGDRGNGRAVLSPTPYMGWNTFYGLGGAYTAAQVLANAHALVQTGLARSGYDIVWLDGGWAASPPRAADGQLQPDPTRFPDGLKPLVAQIHAMGLKAGIYTDAGPYLSAHCGVGSYGHYQTDADTFARWGFDAVKVDFLCGIAANLDPKTVYTEFADAIEHNSAHRRMIFNICNPVTSPYWGNYPESQQSTNTWTYAPAISQAWRTYTDIGFQGDIEFVNVLRNFDANSAHPEVAGPGHFNDPDYLGPQLSMTDEEFRTQFALWAISAAPLIIGSDITKLDSASLDTLKNVRMLSIDQDRLGKQGTRVGPAGSTEVWVKPLEHGSRAVLLLNRGDSPATIATDADTVGLHGRGFVVTDVWTGAKTESAGVLSASVPPHGAAVLIVTPAGPPARLLPPRVVVSAPVATHTLTAPGASLTMTTAVTNTGSSSIWLPALRLDTPQGWASTAASVPWLIKPGATVTVSGSVTVPGAAPPGAVDVTARLEYRTLFGRRSTQSAPLGITVAPPAPTGVGQLSDHPWVSASSGWRTAAVDESVGGSPIEIAGTVYAHGIGVASPSTVRYYLGGACTTLTGVVGIDDAVNNVGPQGGTVTFTVTGDGVTKFATGVITRGAATPFTTDVAGVTDLQLVVGDAGDGGYNDRADWADLTISCNP